MTAPAGIPLGGASATPAPYPPAKADSARVAELEARVAELEAFLERFLTAFRKAQESPMLRAALRMFDLELP
jgi:hypothetical protein